MPQLSEKDIRRLAQEAIKQLGDSATPEAVEEVVKQAIDKLDEPVKNETVISAMPVPETPRKLRNRIIITAFGKNRTGILAGLTGVLARHNCDIIDLSQKILQDFFTIMLLVDIAPSNEDFEFIKNEVTRKGEELDLKVIVQHEEIFNTMHRV